MFTNIQRNSSAPASSLTVQIDRPEILEPFHFEITYKFFVYKSD